MPSRRLFLQASLPVLATGLLPATAVRAQKAAETPARLSFNTDGVKRLLELRQKKDAGDVAISALLELPAYKNLLRVGEAEGSLTRDRLAANAREVILGTATPRSQPREDAARLVIPSEEVCRDLMKQLDDSAAERSRRVAAHVRMFTPEKVQKDPPAAETVYLHLGGTWDALNVNGDMFLNFHYWLEYNRPSLDGLNLVVAHEAMHTVQTRAYGNPEDQESGMGAFFTALSKIQREGTARLVETDVDPEPYGQYTYGFFYRAVDNEALRDFVRLPRLLEPLHDAAFPVFDKGRFIDLYSRGMDSGGPFYALGHGAAKAIDERFGRAGLLATVEGGPKLFWTRYAEAARSASGLPRLPEAVEARLKELPDRLPAK